MSFTKPSLNTYADLSIFKVRWKNKYHRKINETIDIIAENVYHVRDSYCKNNMKFELFETRKHSIIRLIYRTMMK